MTAPKRVKDREDWTVDEHVEFKRTGREPLTDEYRAHVLQKAELHGIDPADLAIDVASDDADLEDLDVQGHFDRIRRHP